MIIELKIVAIQYPVAGVPGLQIMSLGARVVPLYSLKTFSLAYIINAGSCLKQARCPWISPPSRTI